MVDREASTTTKDFDDIFAILSSNSSKWWRENKAQKIVTRLA